MTNLIAKHGGYRNLKSFQMAEIVYDLTFEFCNLYVNRAYKTNEPDSSYRSARTAEQMIQAARSGSRNIAEGSTTSGTSKQSELRLVTVARASLDELKDDCAAFLRQRNLPLWNKNDKRALEIRRLAYMSNKSNMAYKPYLTNAESAANCLLCLINQANFLLDRQLRALENDFKNHGDFKDRIKAFKKKQILGQTDDYGEFLKQHGLKMLENGRVIGINEPDKKQDKQDS